RAGELAAVAGREAAGVERQSVRQVEVHDPEPFLLALFRAERGVDLEAVDEVEVLVVAAAADAVLVRGLVAARDAGEGLDGAEAVRVRERRGDVLGLAAVERRDAGLAVAADGLDLDLPERDVRLVEAHVEAGRLVFADGDRVRGGLEADGRDGERVAAGRDADREAAVVLRRRPERGAGDEHGRAGDRGAAALGD